jgi:hypothetical protein
MMATLFAPPELLSVYAYAEEGSGLDLRKGTHLRLFAGHGESFPLAPFVVFKLEAERSEPRGLHVTDRMGALAPQGLTLSTLGVASAIPILGDDDQRRTVRLELIPSEPEGLDRAVLIDQSGRAIAQRRAPRWQFSAPAFHQLRLEGRAQNVGLRTSVVRLEQILNRRVAPAAVLGLPIAGVHPWYVGGQNRAAALARVTSGAPLRLNVMDRPNGPLEPVRGDDETRRVEAMLAGVTLGGGLEKMLANLVNDGSAPPWSQTEVQELTEVDVERRHTVRTPRAATLQFAALDPGLARFFGFATHIDDLPDLDLRGGWDVLAVASVFAMAPRTPRGRPAPAEGEDALIDLVVRAIREQGGPDVRGDLDRSIGEARAQGLQVRAAVALAAPTPPWDPPDLPRPDIVDLKWQPPVRGEPSALYRAGFAFNNRSLTTLAAVSAELDGAWTTRHAPLAVPGAAPEVRAQPRMFGQENRPGTRRLGVPAISLQSASLLAEHDLPAVSGEIRCAIRASDLFGRFGPSVEFNVAPPPRPRPPRPVLRHRFERAAIDMDSTAPQVPGAVKVLVDSAVVPKIGDLAAGSLPIARLELSLLGPPESVDVTVPGVSEVVLPVGPLGRQAQGSWTLTGVFYDADNTASEPATVTVSVQDVRPPKPYPTGVGLFWTSTPGPSPDVELRLAWPAPKDSQHRVYLADEHGLGLTAEELGANPSRGRVGAAGCRKVLEGRPVARDGFRLLTDSPIKAGADGRAVLETALPRSLSSVQFLRMVPLGPDGAEPLFASCGIVAVAVPDGRRPPPPTLEGTVDPATGSASLNVVADGFDLVALRRDERGLFAAGEPGVVPPRFRIRRGTGPVPDPIYARTVAEGDLVWTNGAFAGEHTDDAGGAGLQPFVRYVYWAEVRLPPERRLPADLNAIDPPGGVAPVSLVGATDSPRPLSPPSAPRTLMRAPPTPPDAPDPPTVTITRQPPVGGESEVTIAIADPPRAHALAIDRYRLAVWTQWLEAETERDIEAATIANGEDLEGVWPSIEDGSVTISVPTPGDLVAAAVLRVRLALVDPLGRSSEITSFDAP